MRLERPLSLDSSLAVRDSSLTANVSQLEGEAVASKRPAEGPADPARLVLPQNVKGKKTQKSVANPRGHMFALRVGGPAVQIS